MNSAQIISSGKILHRELYELVLLPRNKNESQMKNDLIEYIVRKYNIPDATNELQKSIGRFYSEFYQKWQKANRTRTVFENKFSSWLNLELKFSCSVLKETLVEPTPSCSKGRPIKLFSESSEKSRRRKIEHLTKSDPAELVLATKIVLKNTGQSVAAKLINEATMTTPTRASKMYNTYNKYKDFQHIKKYDENEALALLIDAKLSKFQYNLIRLQAKNKNANIYPSYNSVRESKKLCYPDPESIVINELNAEIKLQDLLNHTTIRIFQTIDQTLISQEINELKLFTKWGLDGSSSHSQYKQRFDNNEEGSDNSIFLTSIVPLLLKNFLEENDEQIIFWENPHSSSTKYCRPVHIQFKKESTELIKSELSNIQNQINELQPTIITLNSNKKLKVIHHLMMTMVDGKVCNAASGNNSSQKCYVCGASPKEMNNIENTKKKIVDCSTLNFGLSILHSWIRFMECLLHVSYRLNFKTWQARGENKLKLESTKDVIQKKFKEIGLLIDQTRQGSGSSNDGNTARRFFSNPTLTAQITGLDEEIIYRFYVILQTLSCGKEINCDAFDKYALNTAKLFVKMYPWFYMPSSVHKVLIHGAIIVKSALLPIGQLSEEAQEARNKDIRRYREHNTRKSSRKNTMTDLLNNLLISSDPFISSLRKSHNYQPKKLLPEAKLLLVQHIEENETQNEEQYYKSSSEDSDTENGSNSDE